MIEWLIVAALAVIAPYCIHRQWQELSGRTRHKVRRWIKGLFA
ncbi:hypothetical protein [Croceicoccus sp. Ery15]|nr:hypothetical protein [Croceicoccus sp. Ery15]